MRDTTGELHHFEPALDVAARVGDGLAMFRGEQLGEAVVVLLRKLQELEQHARASLRIGGGPAKLRSLGVGDGLLDFRFCGESHLGLHLAGIGIKHVAEAPRGALHVLAADEVADVAHSPSPCKS